MDSVSFPKGYLLSSTPVQSCEDSGYFGSGQRRLKSNVNVLNSCSPIKESSYKNAETFPLQYELCSISPRAKFSKGHVDSLKNESSNGLEINESSELKFKTCDFTYESELYKSVIKTRQKLLGFHSNSSETDSTGLCSSLSGDRDIQYKLFECESSDLCEPSLDDFEYLKKFNESPMPREYANCVRNFLTFKQIKIDFIHELKIRNCLSIISCLLSYLSPKELCIGSCVSKEWNEVIFNDPRANSRRENYIAEIALFLNGPSKENRLGMKNGPAKEHKKAFSNLSNITADACLLSTNPKIMNTKFDSFIKEAKTEQKLLKCPKCSYASKCLDGNNCACTHCCYRFCSHCLGPILKCHTCFKKELPNIVIGSKKSKKNLRRLKL